MELPGITPYSGQPTVTNPLSRERALEGRETESLERSETQNTVTSSEKETTAVNSAEIVTQVEETTATSFDRDNIGRSIDITA